MTAPVRHLKSPGATGIRDTSAQDVVRDDGPRRRRRRLLWAGAAMVLIAAVVWVARSDWWSAERAVNAERLRIATVERGTFTREITAPGVVIAAVSPTVYAPSAGVVTLNVKAGDLVQAGDVVATLDSPELTSQRAQEAATLESLSTNLQRRRIEHKQQALRSQQLADIARMEEVAAARELRRAQAAWDIKVIARQDLEKAQDDLQRAQVELAHARSAADLERESLEFELRTLELERDRQALLVEELDRRVADLTVRAPVSGMIGTVAVVQKEAVAANAPLLAVVDLSALEVEARIAESYGDRLAPGMPATVSYGGEDHAGVLRSISPEVTENSVLGRIGFDGATPGGLRQNQRVTVTLSLDSVRDALTIPRGAFLDTGAGRVIYVVEDGVATRRAIRTGATSGGRIEILEGLNEGERVVVSSLAPFRSAERALVTD